MQSYQHSFLLVLKIFLATAYSLCNLFEKNVSQRNIDIFGGAALMNLTMKSFRMLLIVFPERGLSRARVIVTIHSSTMHVDLPAPA
jgi:hypothetical protein